jgi:hypothetical protein
MYIYRADVHRVYAYLRTYTVTPQQLASWQLRIVDGRLYNQPVRLAGGWWLILVCSDRKVLLAGCWWLVCCERKVLLAGG